MPVTVRIPTPLRPFTGQQSSVDDRRRDRRRDPRAADHARMPSCGRICSAADGPLRSFVNVYVNDEDIRYLDRERDAGERDGHDQHRAVGRRRDRRGRGAGGRAAGAHARRSEALQPASDHAGGRRRGSAQLKAARVLCVGAGGLGSPASLYLAAAGVGTLGLVDFDIVDVSNLQRQILYSTGDVGRRKLEAAAERLTALNPDVQRRRRTRRGSRPRTRSTSSRSTTSSSTARTTFRRAIS